MGKGKADTDDEGHTSDDVSCSFDLWSSSPDSTERFLRGTLESSSSDFSFSPAHPRSSLTTCSVRVLCR